MPKPVYERRSGPIWVGWLALLLAILILAGLIAFAVAALVDVAALFEAFRSGVPPARFWSQTASHVLAALAVVIVVIIYLVDRAQKPAEYAHVKERIDAGHMFFLYLRPFAIERRLLLDLPMISGIPYLWALPPVRHMLGLEPNLKRAMEAVGALMVAIGEMDRDPGIAKLTPSDAEWQQLFVDLAGRACGIFVIPFTTAGSQWEMDWLLDNALGKTILVLPPVQADPIVGEWRNHSFERQWQVLRDRYAGLIELPDYRAQGMLLTLRYSAGETGARWVPDVIFPLDRTDLDAAVGHLLGAGRLGGLVEF